MEQQINVLIADHQKDIRQGLKALLRFSPYIKHIWEASDGESAIRLVNQINPDLVIIAAKLPMMGGVYVTRWIKQNHPEIKVIVLTIYPHYEDEALAAGANRFLVKGKEDYTIQDEILALFHDGSTES